MKQALSKALVLSYNGAMNWNVIGFEKNKNYFENALKNGNLSHAYLFWGQEMIGKKSFAQDLFRLVNGREFDSDPDFKLISPKTEEGEMKIYIEDMRNLKSFFSLKPFYGLYKFAVINNAETLTPEASNAILKILEEPPSFSVIILITSKPKYLLSTVQSRCNMVRFLSPDKQTVSDYLASLKTKREDREFLLKTANGRLGWVIENRERIPELRKSFEELNKVSKQGVFEKIQFAKKLYEKENYGTLINDWANYVYSDVAENRKILKKLISLNHILSQPQFNHRLALENFLINI